MVGDNIVVISICALHLLLTEAIGTYLIYSKQDFKDLQEKITNLGRRLKTLKYEYIYVPSTKKKQEAKMIKVQEDNYKDAHKNLSALKN